MAVVLSSVSGTRAILHGIRGCKIRVLGVSAGRILPCWSDQQVAGIISPASYRPEVEKPKPWPYESKKFTVFHQFIDSTGDRLDENSKVIVVDGNLATGKTEFAKSLADRLGFHYVRPVNEKDLFYSREFGMDMRRLNYALSKDSQYYDLRSFLSDPHPEKGVGSKLQLQFYMHKLLSYAWGLHHLLSTGKYCSEVDECQ